MLRQLKSVVSAFLKRVNLVLNRLPNDDYFFDTRAGIIPFSKISRMINQYELTLSTKADFTLSYQVVKDNTMVPYDVLASLYDQSSFLVNQNIEGDIVECGVWKGGAIATAASAILKSNQKLRNIHLFDSFDDICEPNPQYDGIRAFEDVKALSGKDGDCLRGELKPIRGIYDQFGGHGTVEECKHLLIEKLSYDPSFIHFHKGWFQDTLPVVSAQIQNIALLRLDSDWHDSTKICLEYLFDKIVPRGILIVDDYGAYEGCRKAVDDFFSTRKLPMYPINSSSFNNECFFFIK